MELNDLKDGEYNQLLCHIDDLKKICEKLKVNLGLLEIPIHNATFSHHILAEHADIMEGSSESSSETSSSDDSE